jgi:hypothetical protein
MTAKGEDGVYRSTDFGTANSRGEPAAGAGRKKKELDCWLSGRFC